MKTDRKQKVLRNLGIFIITFIVIIGVFGLYLIAYGDSPSTSQNSETIDNQKPKMVIDLSQEEIELLIRAVQYEVSYSPEYFPGSDFDYIQQLMTKVIINRIGRTGFGDTLYDVLTQPGQFMDLEDLEKFSPVEKRTTANVYKVLLDEVPNISNDLIYEMSFVSLDLNDAIQEFERQVGDFNPYYSAITADGRMLIFGEAL